MSHRVLKKTVVVVVLSIVLTACKIIPPTSADYDLSYDFSNLKSYAWVVKDEENQQEISTLRGRRQINAIETELTRKGFIKLIENIESADFLLRTHTITDKKVDVDAFYNTWGYYPFGFYDPYAWPRRASSTISREYEIGTLVLDIIDNARKEVIWSGSVSRKLGIYNNRTPAERASIALKNAAHLLQSFPPN